ncbi:lymphocyte expansion molecule-like [Erpetoichthys calabaricus]|uniref:lymphocyte expansion molecule-like n=1 Tax=Erpetoichthys calabaricus TaxID=27687 RepID=UPI002233F561|nr:lymphocyte expansion molecule-like [Erpetoichthys calabaricus]
MATKKFSGAPFGIQSARFDVSGVHPNCKTPGGYTQVPYCKRANSEGERRLGPGTYNVDTGDFSSNALARRAQGPGWKRQLETSRLAKMPQLLYREAWKNKQFLKSKVGPGSYKIQDFMELRDQRPSSVRGVCETREQRFKKRSEASTPGPGSYGEGGIPWAAVEETQRQRRQNHRFEGSSSVGRELLPVGCHLGPGTYNLKDSIELLLSHTVSNRGPYDVFTGSRSRPVTCGYFCEPVGSRANPGEYKLKNFVELLDNKERYKHGVFGTLPQYPAVCTDRMGCTTISHQHPTADWLGPGCYDIKLLTRPENHSAPPFMSSSARASNKTESQGPGVGRYDISRPGTAIDYRSAFHSKTQRYLSDLQRDKHLMERLRSANLQGEQKLE